MRRARSFRLIAGVTAAAIALAACGNSSTTATSSSTTSSSVVGTTATSDGGDSGTGAGGCGTAAAGAATESTSAMSSESTEPSVSTAAAGEALQVGLAFDTGGRGDGTFNDSAASGADLAEEQLGVTVTELEANSDDDRVPNLTTLTNNKNNPIIAVGFLWTDTVAAAAAANPDLTYAIIDSVVDEPNVKSLVFAEEQGSFLVGAAAALKSTTCKIGFIGGQEGALIKRFEAGLPGRREGRRSGHRDRVQLPGRRG